MTPTRNPASVQNGDIRRAARALPPLFKAAREYLAIFQPRVCICCHHVFAPSRRPDGSSVSARCLDCEVRL